MIEAWLEERSLVGSSDWALCPKTQSEIWIFRRKGVGARFRFDFEILTKLILSAGKRIITFPTPANLHRFKIWKVKNAQIMCSISDLFKPHPRF